MSPEEKEKIETVDLNVVLLPDKKTQTRLIKLSQMLAGFINSDFVLNDSQFPSHLSIFPNQYPERNKGIAARVIEEIARNSSPFTVTLRRYSQISGYIFIDALKTPGLVDLHTRAVNALNPIRENRMLELVADLKGLTPEQKAQVEKYGAPIVFDTWVPHVTLTHTEEGAEQIEQALAQLPDVELTFAVDALHLTRFGEWGTCPEIIETFEFSSRS